MMREHKAELEEGVNEVYWVNKFQDYEEELKDVLWWIAELENELKELMSMLIDEDLNSSWMYSMVKDELIEEDLKLRKKLDDLEQGLYKLNKDLKPTLLTMEKELEIITEEVKSDWEVVEAIYDKLLETRWGF